VRLIRPGGAHTPLFSGEHTQGPLKSTSASQNGFHRNSETSDLLIAAGYSNPGRPQSGSGQAAEDSRALGFGQATGYSRTSVPFLASEFFRTLEHSSIPRNGFTLIEVVVALCIVTILTAIAIPGFRKATEDFRLNEFACNFDSLIKAYRSYYLIFNEWPGDGGLNTVPAGRILYFLPNHLHKGNQLTYTPLRKSGTSFDFENWINLKNSTVPAIGLTARSLSNDFQSAWEKLQSLGDYKNHFYNIKDVSLATNRDIFYRFPDIPLTNNENRYY
jgi:prepilin-type N-terminal cleavage/methylation domain-containing protein